MKKIKVKIDVFGNPTIDTEGYVGKACGEATQKLEEVLSGSDEGFTKELKKEWHDKNDNHQEVHEKW